MAYLVAAVVLVGLLCMVNLLLTVGLIRRLRRQSPPQPPMAAGLAPGGSVPRFAATTTSGEPVSDELLGAPALVGFFSPGCRPCVDLLPLFAERARGTSDGVLAVIADGPGGDATVYLEQLEQVARVVVEAPQGPADGLPGQRVPDDHHDRRRGNGRRQPPHHARRGRGAVRPMLLAAACGLAGLALLAVRLRATYLVIRVRGNSMAPALTHGDRLLSRRTRLEALRTGQIAVVLSPARAAAGS
ncbi:hypothetical protein ACFQ0B_32145 [Nonomuraea thailandensis]